MSLTINDDHHDTRTCEGIADLSHPVETRAEEGIQSAQFQAESSACDTGEAHSGVLAESNEDRESDAGKNEIGE